MKKIVFCLFLMIIPTSTYAEGYEVRNQYGERIGTANDMGNSGYSIRNNYGQEVGRLVPESTYEAPKYMPELGDDGTGITVHLPPNEDMLR